MEGGAYPILPYDYSNVFCFWSKGKSRDYPMVICFSKLDDSILREKGRSISGLTVQNLGLLASTDNTFHDIESFSDKVETKNGDMDKIFNTVANVSSDYLTNNPEHTLFISGATVSRHRKFSMALSSSLQFMNENGYNVLGHIEKKIEPFSANTKYDFYLINKR